MKKERKMLLIVFLLIIFFIDQTYFITPQKSLLLPEKIYTYLSTKKSGPVLDIPYSIRDGLRFLGNKNAVWHPYASLIHQQPIYDNYAGRINEDIFLYYENDPFFGFLNKIINSDLKDYEILVNQIDINQLKESINFFNINNIILFSQIILNF